jgi:hypothetical protein
LFGESLIMMRHAVVWPCQGSGRHCLVSVEWEKGVVFLRLLGSERLTDSGASFWSWLGASVGPGRGARFRLPIEREPWCYGRAPSDGRLVFVGACPFDIAAIHRLSSHPYSTIGYARANPDDGYGPWAPPRAIGGSHGLPHLISGLSIPLWCTLVTSQT